MIKSDFENEKIFIQLLKKGEESAYKYLYDLYYSELCSYAVGLCGNVDLAQDIVQQTIIKFWRNRHKIVIINSVKKYLFKCVYHQFIDTHRKKTKEIDFLNELKQEIVLEIIDSSKEDFEKKIQLIEIEINKLPVKCKNIFLLSKKEGFKYREIAAKLNISIKTVETQMTLALKKLRNNIKNSNKNLLLLLSIFTLLNK